MTETAEVQIHASSKALAVRPNQPAGRPWLAALMWAAVAAGLVWAFADAFAAMWRYHWFPAWDQKQLGLYDRLVEGESYYTHAPLVGLVVVALGWLLLRHTKVPVRPRPVWGVLVLAFSLLVKAAATIVGVQFIQGFAFVGAVLGLILLIWGGGALRRLWFPAALLLFMMPVPPMVIAEMNFRLKMFAASGGVFVANMLGFASERAGSVLFLAGDKSMTVGNACSGLRTLISLVAFGALYAYICRLRGWSRLLLFAMCLPVAIFSNGLRIVCLIIVASIWDVPTATGKFHDISGIFVYGFAFLCMFGLEKLFLWLGSLGGRKRENPMLFGECRKTDEDADQSRRLLLAAGSWRGGLAVLLLAATAVAGQCAGDSGPQISNLARGSLPKVLSTSFGELTAQDVPLDEKTERILGTKDYINRRYVSKSGTELFVCITFSQGSRRGSHPPDVCMEGGGRHAVAKGNLSIATPGGDVPCREMVLQSEGAKEYCLYTYRCGQGYTDNWYWQQVTVLGGNLIGKRLPGALVRINKVAPGGDVELARRQAAELMQVVVGHLNKALADVGK